MLELKVGKADDAMDALTFISSVIGSIAWPIAAFAIAFLFRAQIRKLLTRIKKLSVGDNSVDFGERLEEAEAEAEAARPATLPEPEGLGMPDQRTAQLIALSPPAAVLDAWRGVESEVRKLANPLVAQVTSIRPRPLTFRAAVKYLLDAGQITTSTYTLLHDLQQLRNAAAHGEDISAADAIRFTVVAKQALFLLAGSDLIPDNPEN